MIIAIDFDGTIVDHQFPEIGGEAPEVFDWLKQFQKAGAKLILWTMRSDGSKQGGLLSDAVEFCRQHGVEFWGVNENPEQQSWTTSPKCYANVYIDDAAFGCPLRDYPRAGSRPVVDWSIVGPAVLSMILVKGRKASA